MHSSHFYKSLAACFLFWVFLFLSSSPAYASDATLYLSPPTGIYTVNVEAVARVFVSSDGASVYGVEGVLVFDPKKMNVVSVSEEGSVLTSWPTPPSFDNEKGEIRFGGIMSKSTVLSRGQIISIVFTPLRAEDFQITFASGAAILAGDGTGGNIVSALKSGDYSGVPSGDHITPPLSPETEGAADAASSAGTGTLGAGEGGDGAAGTSTDSGEVLGTSTQKAMISSSSHPDQDAWYALATSTFAWEMPADVTRVRLSFNKKPEGEGTVPYSAPINEKLVANIPEGIQYFHLTREWSDGHTDSATYRIQTDVTPHTALTLTEKPRADAADPQAVFLISATDTLSGVDHYEISLDGRAPATWVPDRAGEYHAPALPPGAHEIMARAVDKAGNGTGARLSFAVEYLPLPVISLDDKKFVEGKPLTGRVSSVPSGTATLFIAKDGKTTEEEITLGAGGSTAFMSTLTLSSGIYEVWVTSRDSRGAISKESEHLTFEASASWLGIIKRHPLIPVVTLLFVVFLFVMRFFWKKLHDSDEGDEAIVGDDHNSASAGSGTVVLASVKHKAAHTPGPTKIPLRKASSSS